MTIALITHPNCLDHNLGSYHPESPDRVHAIQDRLISSGLEMLLQRFDAPLARHEHLLRVHDSDYLDGIEKAIPDHDDTINWLDGDTGLTHHTIPAALRAAGAAVLAVDLVMKKETTAAFCLVRPPGHHAERRRARCSWLATGGK